MVAVHRAQDEIAVFDDQLGPAFDEAAEPVRVKCNKGEQGCNRTSTSPPPSVAKNAALPLIARESTDARMTSKTASKAVLGASDRLWPNRTIISVAINTPPPRNEI